jgi:hypothetical protein
MDMGFIRGQGLTSGLIWTSRLSVFLEGRPAQTVQIETEYTDAIQSSRRTDRAHAALLRPDTGLSIDIYRCHLTAEE